MSTLQRVIAISQFFDLWQSLGQTLANNPKSWPVFRQDIARPESDTARQVENALRRIDEANKTTS